MGCGTSVSSAVVGLPINNDAIDGTHFALGPRLGQGGFADVVSALKITNDVLEDKGTVYAIKIMSKKKACKRKMTAEIFTERRMLSELSYPFICNSKYMFQDDENVYMVMDYAGGGDVKVRTSTPPPSYRRPTALTPPQSLCLAHAWLSFLL